MKKGLWISLIILLFSCSLVCPADNNRHYGIEIITNDGIPHFVYTNIKCHFPKIEYRETEIDRFPAQFDGPYFCIWQNDDGNEYASMWPYTWLMYDDLRAQLSKFVTVQFAYDTDMLNEVVLCARQTLILYMPAKQLNNIKPTLCLI